MVPRNTRYKEPPCFPELAASSSSSNAEPGKCKRLSFFVSTWRSSTRKKPLRVVARGLVVFRSLLMEVQKLKPSISESRAAQLLYQLGLCTKIRYFRQPRGQQRELEIVTGAVFQITLPGLSFNPTKHTVA
mmetsp:Transcript_30336/g.49429  ORF Transcript_30336/g.49429 Transcript_30336/m.49429 type:complete len:131 (-) Transcript_30336:8-400(-)